MTIFQKDRVGFTQKVRILEYLFEIIITNTNNTNLIIRKIKNSIIDKIISLEDQIYYDNINKIKINIIDINNPKKNAEIKIKLNNKIK